jgi:hypothetical protein
MTELSNLEFLKTIKAPYPPLLASGAWGQFLICHRIRNTGNWKAKPVCETDNIDWPNHDAFFNIALVKPVNGKLERKKENFASLPCIVLDDVGTKAKRPELAPSWIIETSPGNEQWGYILYPAITDHDQAEALMKAVINAGYSDKGATSPTTRYMRMPVGSNGKKKHMDKNGDKPVPHVLKLWEPNKTFTKDQIAEELNLTLDEAPAVQRPVKAKPDSVAKEFYAAHIEKMREMLRFIDPDCDRGTWIKIGMIIHNETNGAAEGLALWDEWSAGHVRT